MYSVEHLFTNLLKDRLIIPRKIVGVLYVDRQGASFPIGCMLPRIFRLSSETKGGRRQADSGTTCPNSVKSSVAVLSLLRNHDRDEDTDAKGVNQIHSRQDECYRERIYNIKE